VIPLGDPKNTLLAEQIRRHYEVIADDLDFDTHRYKRLAAALKLNVYELGAVLRLSPSEVDARLESGRYGKQVELQLYLMQQAFITGGLSNCGFPDLPIDGEASSSAPCSSTSTS